MVTGGISLPFGVCLETWPLTLAQSSFGSCGLRRALILHRFLKAMCDKRDGEHVDAARPTFQEGGGAGIRRRTRGHDVIDQQDALAAHPTSPAAADAESIRHIVLTRL